MRQCIEKHVLASESSLGLRHQACRSSAQVHARDCELQCMLQLSLAREPPPAVNSGIKLTWAVVDEHVDKERVRAVGTAMW